MLRFFTTCENHGCALELKISSMYLESLHFDTTSRFFLLSIFLSQQMSIIRTKICPGGDFPRFAFQMEKFLLCRNCSLAAGDFTHHRGKQPSEKKVFLIKLSRWNCYIARKQLFIMCLYTNNRRKRKFSCVGFSFIIDSRLDYKGCLRIK